MVQESAHAARLRVLIADDDRRLRELMMLLLSDDYDVDVAASGEEALAILERRAYDAFLCDLSMPGAGAREVHAHLLETNPDAARRLVVVSGGAFTDDAERFLELSGCARVPKPFSPNDVARAVEMVVARHGRRIDL
ncbi:MAG: response regulator [Myxococcota bacterium]